MADNTIDTLQIKISSDANKAVQAITALQSKLTGLNTALGGLNTGGLSSLASGVSQLSHAMSAIKSGKIKTADFSRIANGLNKLSAVDVQGVSNASRAVSTLTANLSQIGTVKFDSVGIDNITNSISKLGRASVTEATQNLEFLKSSVAEFVSGMNNVGSLNFGTDNLYKLISSVSRLGSENATQSVNNLPQISTYLREFVTSMNSIGSVSFDFTGLNNLVANISRLGGSKATQSVQNLKPIKDQLFRFISGLNGIGSLDFDLTGLNGLVSAISKLGGKAATNAIPNIQALGVALKQLMATLATAPAVSQNLISMTNALANLASSGSKVGSASRAMQTGLNGYSISAKSAKNHTMGLAAAFGKFYATYWLILRGFKQLGKAIDLSSDLTEVQNVVDVTFGQYASLVEEFSNTSIENFGISELTAKQVSSRFQAMGTAMGFSKGRMTDMSIELTKLAADMASFYNVEQKVVAEDLASIFTGETRPLRTYGLDLTQATLQEWAFKQGIDAKVKSMSQAEKTLLRYQYVMANTGSAQGDFAKTSGTWANQLRILNENFKALGSIVGGVLINAFKPFITALNQVMSAVMQFAKVISDALGAIFGWEFQVGGGGGLAGAAGDIGDISDGAGGAADNLGDAADNAKKLKENLQGFDELNVIASSDSSSGGGGGGGGGGAANPEDIGKWVPAESLWEKYTSSLDSLFKLGEYIGNTLTDAMNSIDWDKVYEGARNFGAGLASFLNGLISPELFGATGRTIAGALNTAIYATLSFGETFDWSDFGLSIATGINEFFNTFDFAFFGKTLSTFTIGLLDTTIISLEKTDWKRIGKKIGEFFENIDWKTIFNKTGKAIGEAIGASIDLLTGINIKNVDDIALGIGAISAAFLTFKGLGAIPKTIGTLSKNFGSLLKTLAFSKYGAIAAGISAVIIALDKFGYIDVNWKTLSDAFGKLATALGKFVVGIGKGLISFIDGLLKVMSPALEGLINGAAAALDGLGNILNAIPEGAISAITEVLASFFTAFLTYKSVIVVGGLISSFANNLKLFASVLPGIVNSGPILKNLAAALGPSALGGIQFTLIAGGLFLLADRINKVTEQAAKNSDIGKFASALDGLSKTVSSDTESINSSLENTKHYIETAGKAETEMTKELADEYERLSSKADLSASDKERLKQVSSELSNIIPGLSKYINEENGYLDVQKNTLDALIAGYESYAQKQAAQEYLVQAYKDQYEAQMNVKNAQDGYNEAFNKYLKDAGLAPEIMRRIADGTFTMEEAWNDFAMGASIDWEEKYGVSNIAILEKAYTGLSEEVEEYETALNEAYKTENNANKNLETLKGTIEEADEAFQKAKETELASVLATDDYKQSLSDLQTTFKDLGITLSDDLMQNLALDDYDPSQIQRFFDSLASGVQASSEDIKVLFSELGLTLPDEITKSLALKEPEIQSETARLLLGIQSGVSANEGQLKILFSNLGINLPDSLVENLSTKEGVVQTSAINLLSKLESGYKLSEGNLVKLFSTLGITIPDELIKSLGSKNEETQKQAIELLGQIKNASDSERQPLIEEFNKLGVGVADEGVIKALNSKQGETKTATDNYLNEGVKTVLSAAKDTLNTLSWNNGKAIVDGVNSGVENNKGSSKSVIGAWVSNLTGWFKGFLGIASPSKVFGEFGLFTVEGFNNGLSDEMSNSFNLMKQWSSGITKSFDIPSFSTGYEINRSILDAVDVNYNMGNINAKSINAQAGFSANTIAELVSETKRRNDLAEEQNELLRGINDKPVIDKNDVGTLYKAYAKDFRNRTGKQLGIQF